MDKRVSNRFCVEVKLVTVQFTSRSACVGGRSAAAETIDKLRINSVRYCLV